MRKWVWNYISNCNRKLDKKEVLGIMDEKAIEWAVKVPETIGHRILRVIFLLMATVTLVVYTMTNVPVGLIGVIVFSCISGWMQMNANVEYVCYYFNEVLEVTPLYNRTRHGKKFTFSMEDILDMVEGVEPQENTKYFCKKKGAEDVYTLLVQQEGVPMAVVLEMEPDFVEMMQSRCKVR